MTGQKESTALLIVVSDLVFFSGAVLLLDDGLVEEKAYRLGRLIAEINNSNKLIKKANQVTMSVLWFDLAYIYPNPQFILQSTYRHFKTAQ